MPGKPLGGHHDVTPAVSEGPMGGSRLGTTLDCSLGPRFTLETTLEGRKKVHTGVLIFDVSLTLETSYSYHLRDAEIRRGACLLTRLARLPPERVPSWRIQAPHAPSQAAPALWGSTSRRKSQISASLTEGLSGMQGFRPWWCRVVCRTRRTTLACPLGCSWWVAVFRRRAC